MLPWCHLCKTDIETITLVEKSFDAGEGIKASCKFFTDILIKDFPPDIFLNRPLIIKVSQIYIQYKKSYRIMSLFTFFSESVYIFGFR